MRVSKFVDGISFELDYRIYNPVEMFIKLNDFDMLDSSDQEKLLSNY